MGNPWASSLLGEPGFLSTLNELALKVNPPLSGDPLAMTLALGIDFTLSLSKRYRILVKNSVFSNQKSQTHFSNRLIEQEC